jgi:hypothetical protein
LLERIDSIKLEKFRSNYYLFQLKIMGIVFRHGIPEKLTRKKVYLIRKQNGVHGQP